MKLAAKSRRLVMGSCQGRSEMPEKFDRAAAMRSRLADPKFCAKRLARLRARFDDPAFAEKHRAISAERMRKNALDKEFQARRLAGLHLKFDDPEFHATAKARATALWKGRRRAGRKVILPWVPPDLAGEFERLARELGEFEACAEIRRIKRKAEQASRGR